MITDIAFVLLLLAGGLIVIAGTVKLVDPKAKLVAPWTFLRPALILGLLGVALLMIAQHTNHHNSGDYGAAALHLLAS